MLSLILTAALCDPLGCDYMDVTRQMDVRTETECWQTAAWLNQQNTAHGQPARFACLEPVVFKRLSEKKEL